MRNNVYRSVFNRSSLLTQLMQREKNNITLYTLAKQANDGEI
jgi:hypothetical protein